jgi:hypothetical protein
MNQLKIEPVLTADAIDYYWDRPVEFIQDNIIYPASKIIHGLSMTHHQKHFANAVSKYHRVSIESGHGCLAKGTEVLMWPMGVKKVEDVCVGDLLMGDDSFPRVVERLWRGQEQMAEIHYRNGEHYKVNMSHKLCVIASQSHGKQKKGDITEVTVRDYLKWSDRKKRTNVGYKTEIHYCLDFYDEELPPYLLGLWLGDGSSDRGVITNVDKDVIDYLKPKITSSYKNSSGCSSFYIKNLKKALKRCGLLKNKHIPSFYLYSSKKHRYDLLAGLIDTDGCLSRKSNYDIVQKNKTLAYDILFLARSLGHNATIKKCKKMCCNNGVWGVYYRINITRNIWKIPVRILRKKALKPKKPQRTNLNMAIKIKPVETDNYYGFTISGNGRFVLKDFTVTRNTGKSSSMSWVACWFLCTRHNTLGMLTKIPIIAPTFHQLYDIIWPEFKRWIPMSRLKALFQTKSDEIYISGYKDNSYIRARSPKEPDNVQGFHAAHLLWICDEAFGITNEQVWETIEGSLTEPDNRIVIAGQHTLMVGYAHDSFNRDKEFWKNLRFNSEESPLAKPEYAARVARKYGKSSPVYRVRVLGMDPGDNPDAFLAIGEVQKAMDRENVLIDGEFCIGLDCARFGDDLTVVTPAVGNHIFDQTFSSNTDTFDIVNLALQAIRKIRKEYGIQRTCYIKVDATGGYGAGAIDVLNKNTEDNIVVVPINFSEGGNNEYHDKISIMWGEIKEKLPYLRLPKCDFLFEELSTRSYKIDSKSRVWIEPKEQYKKDHESSPDRSDSLALCLTSKAIVQRVWPYYISTNPTCKRKFNLDFRHMSPEDGAVYGVMTRDKDTGIYGNWFFWGRKTRVLRVISEFVHTSPVIEDVVYDALDKASVPLKKKPNEVCVEKVFANDECFKDGNNLKKAFRRYGITLKQNSRFEPAASIAVANQMFREHRTVVHATKCPETDLQWNSWRIENKMPAKGYPLCNNLLIVVNELKSLGELTDKLPMQPYSQRKYNLRNRLRKKESGALTGNDKREYDYLLS